MSNSQAQRAYMQKRAIAVAAIVTLASTSVFADDMAVKAPPAATVWNRSGFYIGAGGSFHSAASAKRFRAYPRSKYNFGPTPVTQAQEGGPFFDFDRHKFGFAPDVQLGYTVPFADGDWQAGLKFNYKYANIDSKENVSIPQAGTLIPWSDRRPPKTSPALCRSTRRRSISGISLRHRNNRPRVRQARNLCRGRPRTVRGRDEVYQRDSFCPDRRGVLQRLRRAVNFTNNNWVWGGAAQVGATYALSPRWFLDLAYTFAQSGNFKSKIQHAFRTRTDRSRAAVAGS